MDPNFGNYRSVSGFGFWGVGSGDLGAEFCGLGFRVSGLALVFKFRSSDGAWEATVRKPPK